MPVTYASPGVYVEEIDRGTKPIEGVGVSMPAFVGITQKVPMKKSMVLEGDKMIFKEESELKHPVLVSNWTQFTEAFGGFATGIYLPDAVYGFFANGGGACYIVSLRTTDQGVENVGSPARAASVVIPANRGNSFTVTAKQPGIDGNKLTVSVVAGEENSFSLSVGGEGME